MKNRMTMSLSMLIGSLLLFVGATLAWLVVSNVIILDPSSHVIVNIDADVELEYSIDGITYQTAENLSIQNQTPGSTIYYRLTIQNTGNTDIHTRVRLNNFSFGAASLLKDTTNHTAGRKLSDVLLLNVTNDTTSATIEDGVFSNYMIVTGENYQTANVILVDYLFLVVNQVAVINFQFSIPGTVGNLYQNLKLDIASIIVDAIHE